VLTKADERLLHALNAICPYYTMFPLSFPLRVLRNGARNPGWVLDPFCGRGSTAFAARLSGLPTVGIDSNPVAVALAKAKLCKATPSEVLRVARGILGHRKRPTPDLPRGDFWELAYHRETLEQICRLRAALLKRCDTDARLLLRAIVLGALHGPRTQTRPSHLSNQSPRTYAPKPAYAVRYWRKHGLNPPRIDVIDVVRVRAERYLSTQPDRVPGFVECADSRTHGVFGDVPFSWIITSPPYYGMHTYLPDQWVRAWFLGGPPAVSYQQLPSELCHSSPEIFVCQLAAVWQNVAASCRGDARLVLRMGGINDRRRDPLTLAKESLAAAGWRVLTVFRAGDANAGKRQAIQFQRVKKAPLEEYDIYARLSG
jgi:hypothetical protein